MSLEEIIQDIESDTRSRVKQIMDQAASEAKKIETDAESEAHMRRESAEEKASTDSKQLLVMELSRANIAAKEMYQNAINDYLVDSSASLQRSLPGYARSSDYPKLLDKLARMAVSELGDNCTIMVQSQDLKKIKASSVKGAKVVKSDEKFSGGLKAESDDGKRSVDYTLESIADLLKDSMGVKLLSGVN